MANEVAHLRAAPAVDKTALRHARNRWGLHRGVHEWIELVLERLLEPEEAEALRSPAWEGERGRPVLRCPARPGGEATQVFFLLHRYRFGTFVSAAMRYTAEGRRLQLLDDRGALLDLGGLTAGYRGQGPRTTLWVLWVAGFEDRFDRIEQGVPFTVLEDLVFTHEEFELTRASGA
jgi:hypothetical protein